MGYVRTGIDGEIIWSTEKFYSLKEYLLGDIEEDKYLTADDFFGGEEELENYLEIREKLKNDLDHVEDIDEFISVWNNYAMQFDEPTVERVK